MVSRRHAILNKMIKIAISPKGSKENLFLRYPKYAIITLYIWIGGCVVDLCETIKSIRRKGLLSQSGFADALGVSFSTVNRWENGKATPNYQALKKIKDFCDKNNVPFDIDRKIWEEKE